MAGLIGYDELIENYREMWEEIEKLWKAVRSLREGQEKLWKQVRDIKSARGEASAKEQKAT